MGLDANWGKEHLEAIFAPYGRVLDSKVLIDLATGVSRGAGLLRFETREQAESAIRALNGVQLQGASMPLTVRLADTPEEKARRKARAFQHAIGRGFPPGMTKGSPPMMGMNYMPGAPMGYSLYPPMPSMQPAFTQQVALYVSNLPPEADEGFLWKLFGPIGAVASVKVVRDLNDPRRSRGYGFVNFVRMEDAQVAIMRLNGLPLSEERTLQVSLKTTKPRGLPSSGPAPPMFFAPPQWGAGTDLRSVSSDPAE